MKSVQAGVSGANALRSIRIPVYLKIKSIAQNIASEDEKPPSLDAFSELVYKKIKDLELSTSEQNDTDLYYAFKSFSGDGVSFETIKKHIHPISKSFGITNDLGNARPKHPLRKDGERLLKMLFESGVPIHKVINDVERMLRRRDPKRKGVSKVTLRKWMEKIQKETVT